jgi:hypothetical protein
MLGPDLDKLVHHSSAWDMDRYITLRSPQITTEEDEIGQIQNMEAETTEAA